jgi:hypothetical protein
MGISDICSPVSRNKVGSNQPLSPGARSTSGRSDTVAAHSVPPQPSHGRASAHQELPIPGSTMTPEK